MQLALKIEIQLSEYIHMYSRVFLNWYYYYSDQEFFTLEYQKEFLSHCISYFVRLRFVGSISFRFDWIRINASKIWLAGRSHKLVFLNYWEAYYKETFQKKKCWNYRKSKMMCSAVRHQHFTLHRGFDAQDYLGLIMLVWK